MSTLPRLRLVIPEQRLLSIASYGHLINHVNIWTDGTWQLFDALARCLTTNISRSSTMETSSCSMFSLSDASLRHDSSTREEGPDEVESVRGELPNTNVSWHLGSSRLH